MAWCGKALVRDFKSLITIVLIYSLLGMFCITSHPWENYRYLNRVRIWERRESVKRTVRYQLVPTTHLGICCPRTKCLGRLLVQEGLIKSLHPSARRTGHHYTRVPHNGNTFNLNLYHHPRTHLLLILDLHSKWILNSNLTARCAKFTSLSKLFLQRLPLRTPPL